MKPKIFIIFSIILVLIFGFLIGKNVLAGINDNVWGWAWSDGIKWISFNSKNCDANNDGVSDGTPVECPTAGMPIANYGVKINRYTGVFSGYAWADLGDGNIGWLSFNRRETGNPPAAPFQFGAFDSPIAKFDRTGSVCGEKYQVCGWARFLTACKDNLWDDVNKKCTGSGAGDKAGGWDGWVKLSGTYEGVTWGGENLFPPPSGTNNEYISVSKLSSDSFVVAYREAVAPYRGKVIIGKTSDSGITFGSPRTFNTGDTSHISVSALDSTHFVVAYKDIFAAPSNYGRAIIGTVSGKNISGYGSESDFNQAYTDYISTSALSSTKIVVAYRDVTSSKGEVAIGNKEYGIDLDISTNPNEFRGWAWGGDKVVGWISFNNENPETPPTASGYKVMADVNRVVHEIRAEKFAESSH